ncbi:unnamed protein product [Periconia digitata]|uniref:Aminotransferase class V domain-containing protein n=1 Tax=Periconia digitata TaxID=1303443 RepID=A0A9W4XPW4_9PLEO|nr:unnamed protein product [Periconia digitata]
MSKKKIEYEIEYEHHARYDRMVGRMKRHEYPMLKGITYLDYAGTALPCSSLIQDFSEQLNKRLISNTHSALAWTPTSPQAIVDTTRRDVLALFNASPAHWEVVFTSNATGAVKLVAEALGGHEEGFDYYYHRDCHTSLVGVRELASNSHCLTSDQETEAWLDCPDNSSTRPTLLAYPAQSNMNGRRLPLHWSSRIRESTGHANSYTLLDIAALASTTSIDLSNQATGPDFLTLSFYKIYGFPDLGALIVRKSASHLFSKRRYFGGGTTDSISKSWVLRKSTSLAASLEDGTLPTHNILALQCAIKTHARLYGGLSSISQHVSWLAQSLYSQLSSLRHANGQPVCTIYKDSSSSYDDSKTQGGVVAFNIFDAFGKCFPTSRVAALALQNGIHLRAGGLCNPQGMAHALGFSDEQVYEAFEAGYRCGQDAGPEGRPFGMVRVSLGASSVMEDVQVFIEFIRREFMGQKGKGVRGVWWNAVLIKARQRGKNGVGGVEGYEKSKSGDSESEDGSAKTRKEVGCMGMVIKRFA